jgi:hypothetical protein
MERVETDYGVTFCEDPADCCAAECGCEVLFKGAYLHDLWKRIWKLEDEVNENERQGNSSTINNKS